MRGGHTPADARSRRTAHVGCSGQLEGEPARQLHALLGRQALVKTVQQFGETSPLTALVPDLNGVGTRAAASPAQPCAKRPIV